MEGKRVIDQDLIDSREAQKKVSKGRPREDGPNHRVAQTSETTSFDAMLPRRSTEGVKLIRRIDGYIIRGAVGLVDIDRGPLYVGHF